MRTISILAGTLICSACLKVETAKAETPVVPPKTALELAAEASVGEIPYTDPVAPPAIPVTPATVAPAVPAAPPIMPVAPSATSTGTWKPLEFAHDADFLEDVEHRSFQFFWDTANPQTGLVPDRSNADGGPLARNVSSIAADGFGLTALCIGVEHGWIDKAAAYSRALATLRFFNTHMSNEHGFFFHYVDMNTGERVWHSEASTIDTWIFLSGALTVRQYFPGTEVAQLATKLYEQADWAWMTDGGPTLTMGWKPEDGFLKARWSGFSEDLGMYLMAIGSSTHPLAPGVWSAFDRASARTQYQNFAYMQYPPLFIHQYPEAWIDFRGSRDAYANYWDNSRTATIAQKAFCESLEGRFPSYAKVWGITASDGQKGYMDWGGPPVNPKDAPDPRIDGTVVPCAAGGSIPFAPEQCIANLRAMYQDYGATIYRKYGFVDAFNPLTGWTSSDVVGIDVGITLIMAENYRTGFVWHTFMENPEIPRAMKAAGFAQSPLVSTLKN